MMFSGNGFLVEPELGEIEFSPLGCSKMTSRHLSLNDCASTIRANRALNFKHALKLTFMPRRYFDRVGIVIAEAGDVLA